ncbi:cation efflux family-domain-containing protein [Fimicolochytrium jonesii]|uniref:cation efflux family-domain-containing protein n=1 Tax=Fimicolochytrium jonesii TaxID=1396493 RepID=UPI0022FEB7C2|nr:cation efflux family-domain-containing protein [Fimicolochytrium jonesii]KAI8818587.1 cation efflux family-domain-containing protein [Fimicolochytrium jonesii]
MSSSLSTPVDIDLEVVRGGESDPLLLRQRKVSDSELENLSKSGKRKLSKFYEKQNELIDDLLRPPDVVEEGEERRLLKLKIAVYGSVVANVCLFALQLVAAVLSGSLALFATTADAFMDLASSLVLVFAGKAALTENPLLYPTGKTRMETAGILIFSIMMGTLSIQLLIEGVRTLISASHDIDLSPISIGLVGAAIGVKIALYLYCRTLSQYPSAKILAQDHRNDVFMNSVGISLSILGSKVVWWLDPLGAILISLLILRSWSSTAWEHVQYIVGKTADSAFLQKVTYISMTHDPRVKQVDTCKAYHAGNNFFVEVDIVLPPDMLVCEAHDIAEALQNKIETLPNVERAFVHIDYETSHAPEHRKAR